METKHIYIEDSWSIDGEGDCTTVEITYYLRDGNISVDSVIDTETGDEYNVEDVDYELLYKLAIEKLKKSRKGQKQIYVDHEIVSNAMEYWEGSFSGLINFLLVRFIEDKRKD